MELGGTEHTIAARHRLDCCFHIPHVTISIPADYVFTPTPLPATTGSRFKPATKSAVPKCVYRSIVRLIVECRASVWLADCLTSNILLVGTHRYRGRRPSMSPICLPHSAIMARSAGYVEALRRSTGKNHSNMPEIIAAMHDGSGIV